MLKQRFNSLEEQIKSQGEVIEALRKAIEGDTKELEPQLMEESQEEDGLDTHIGEPTPKQLEKINNLLGRESEASEWTVCAFYASNNFIDLSLRRWSESTMYQMAMTAVGRPHLIDHDWSRTESSIGFVFDAKVVKDKYAPEDVIKAGGYEKFNREILEEEGHVWLYLNCAIASTHEAAEDIKARRKSDGSTGSILNRPYMLCPNCSREHGRPVSFMEKEYDPQAKKEVYTCPHNIPSTFILNLLETYGEDIESFNFADYVTLGAVDHQFVEMSSVNRGALPAVKIIRGEI
jgi:Sec-independent protein translocase protein TatA